MTLEAAIAEAVRDAVKEALAGVAATPLSEKRLLKVKEVAVLIGLSDKNVRALIARGDIPTRDVEPYSSMLVARSDLDAWVDSLPSRRAGHDQKTA